MVANGVRRGDRFGYCQMCGRRFFVSQLRLRWDNLWVCPSDYELRNPQEFVTGLGDPYPEFPILPAPAIVEAPTCTINGLSDVVGYAVVGCAIVGSRGNPTPQSYCLLENKTSTPGVAMPGCAVPGA